MTDYKFCAVCITFEEEFKAETWCSKCSEWICESCAKNHKRYFPAHNLVTKDESYERSRSKCTPLFQVLGYCDIHPTEGIVKFCRNHDQVLCETCTKTYHKSCEDIMAIHEASEGVKESTAFKDLVKRIDNVLSVTFKIKEYCINTEKSINEQRELIDKEIEKVKKSFTDHLDHLERYVKNELNKKYERGRNSLEQKEFTVTQICDTMNTLKRELLTVEKNSTHSELFQAVKGYDCFTNEQETRVRDLYENSKDIEITFEKANDIYESKTILDSFGKIIYNEKVTKNNVQLEKFAQSQIVIPGFVSTKFKKRTRGKQAKQEVKKENTELLENVNCTYVCSFKTTQIEDKTEVRHCLFINLPFSKSFLLFSSNIDKCLYICNRDGSSVDKILLEYKPTDITTLNENSVLVMLGYEGIQLIDLSTLSLSTRMKIAGGGKAITSSNEDVWIDQHFGISKIDIADGKTLKEIPLDFSIEEMCIAESGEIYLSECLGDNILKITSEGGVLLFYEHPELRNAVGVTVDNNCDVYVAGKMSHNIHKISKSGLSSRIILSEKDGIYRPTGLSFNKQTNELMIINEGNTSIIIYAIDSLPLS
ncbi:unnamed protein product [Mytilus coruscus]|uniref:B box-type domain-containing protein n=1 Tax=Mytilus coruscus TaxID=42192 RepID=A0A6J8DH86_MYTCO|nr:unnamed protein product [Mytilus coruscus]